MTDARVRRLLMTGDTVGGVWTYSLELAAALETHGVEVVLAALGGPLSPGQRAEASQIPNLHVLESGFKLEWMEDPWRDVEASGRWLLDLEEEYAPDVVHLNTFGHGGLKWQTPVVLTAHSCVLSWWEAVKGQPAPATWNRYRGEVEIAVHCADRVTAPSRAMARSIEYFYGTGCSVVPNGRSAARFRSGSKEPFVLTAGRLWDEGKNAEAVAHVAPGLAWPVYLAGGSEHPNGSSLTAQGCRFLGQLPLEELADWYARASIYALPARYEPFGLSILEAALSGCALVLGDIDSLREMWDGAAVFVRPDRPKALEEAINGLIDDPARREALAEEAGMRANGYTPERMARNYLRLYRTLASSGRRVCAS